MNKRYSHLMIYALPVFTPNNLYNGHKPVKAVTIGTTAKAPHHDLKQNPAAMIIIPGTILVYLSALPTFFLIMICFFYLKIISRFTFLIRQYFPPGTC